MTAAALLAAAAGIDGAAAQLGPTPTESSDEPAVITADELVYDDSLDMVVARGNVEVSQGGRLLRAERVTYNRVTEIVTASGNVVLRDPGGELYFADFAELDDDLANGFIERIGILFPDDSRVAAVGGVRREGRVTDVDRAVYSPCDLCEDDPDRPPLWQLRAARVTHDSERKDVIYRDAYLDMFGVPILYTPFLSHPDPTVDQRTGFLTPSFGSTATLGPFVNNFFYWGINPNQDATFTLGVTRDAGILLGAEYRHRFADGYVEVAGSINQSDRVDLQNGREVTVEDEGRFHLFGDAQYNFNQNWRAGASIRAVSDDTYLESFEISQEDELTSRAYVERFDYLDYFAVEAYSIRDLRAGAIDQPIILPWVTLYDVGEPGGLAGGQWYLDGELLALTRDEDVPLFPTVPTEGTDTRRASVEVGWTRSMAFDTGLVTNLKGLVRGTAWWSDDVDDRTKPPGAFDDVGATKLFPLALAEMRYPLVRQYDGFQHLIEPIAGLRLSADIGSEDDKIPNNDSVAPEFDHINLFSESVYPGIDRVDDGLVGIYGLRTGVYRDDGAYASLFLGQQYRFVENNALPDSIGVGDNASHIVGRLSVRPRSWYSFDWRFRVDPDDWDLRRSDVDASVSLFGTFLSATYSFIDEVNEPNNRIAGQEEIILRAARQLTPYWSANASLTRDIDEETNRTATASLLYEDECFTFGVQVEQDLTQDRDREEGTSIFLRIAFRNLGEVPIAITGSDLVGGGESN